MQSLHSRLGSAGDGSVPPAVAFPRDRRFHDNDEVPPRQSRSLIPEKSVG